MQGDLCIPLFQKVSLNLMTFLQKSSYFCTPKIILHNQSHATSHHQSAASLP